MTNEKIYTPEWLAEQMLIESGFTGFKSLTTSILDNSCGKGVFLNAALNYVLHEYFQKYNNYTGVEKVIKNNIVGIEIDKAKFDSAIELLSKTFEDTTGKAPGFQFSIYNDDFYKLSQAKPFQKTFDIIIGNFPVSLNTGTYPAMFYEGENLFMKFISWSHPLLKDKGFIYTITPLLSQVELHKLKDSFKSTSIKKIKKADIFEDTPDGFMLVKLLN